MIFNGEKTWIQLRSSLWFIPAVCVIGAVALAIGIVELDRMFATKLQEAMPRFFGISSDGARGILTAISSSTITVAGVVFSIVIVALSIASNQYTPRVLRTFMRDRATQSVLGVFVAVFTYSIIVLRTVRSGEEPFVPSLGISLAILLALVSIGFLVYFIHHIASAIQAPTMISSICAETIEAIENLFPAPMEQDMGRPATDCHKGEWIVVNSKQTGYLQAIGRSLSELASEQGMVIRVERKTGEFIVAGTPLLSVCCSGSLPPKVVKKILRCVAMDNFRTVEQDPSYGIRQIVDIAVKALSPGVNDTSTAINCIDYLGAILHVAVQRERVPKPTSCKGRVTLIHKRCLTVEGLLDEGFMQIRQSGKGNPAILLRLLKVIGATAAVAKRVEYLAVLEKHVGLVAENSDSIASKHDRDVVLERVERVKKLTHRARRLEEV